MSDLVDHYRQRELEPDTAWKTHSTKVTYHGYLNKWILPRWGAYPLSRIRAGEVELWLRSLPLARSTCAKARTLLCILSMRKFDTSTLSASNVQLAASGLCSALANRHRSDGCNEARRTP